jgi:hypothetical protein
MTLQTTGPISLGNVGSELGRPTSTATSLGETAVRNLAGIASGVIKLSNLYGKSSVAFTPTGGLSSGSPVTLSDWAAGGGNALVTIQCTQSAVWTWTRTGSSAGTSSVASGGSAGSITFALANTGFTIRQTNWTVSATSGGITRYWLVELFNEGFV